MIDGVMGVCPACGELLDVIRDTQFVGGNDSTVAFDWRCPGCKFMGRYSWGRQWFKERLAPAIRSRAGKGNGEMTDDELTLRVFEFDLEAIKCPADLELYWKGQRRDEVPKEKSGA